MSLEKAVALAVVEAEENGVLLDAVCDEESIWISNIERDGGRPGSGAQVLLAIIDIAEDHDVPVRGAVVQSHEALLSYYSKFGFEPVSHDTAKCGRNQKITVEYRP